MSSLNQVTIEKSKTEASVRMDVALSVEPEHATFNPGGGKSEHMLVNLGEKRLAVKIRCSNNNCYRVNPVILFIESGQCQNISVTRLPGPVRQDKLIIQYIPCTSGDSDAKKLFSDKNLTPAHLRVELKVNSPNEKPKGMSFECVM